MFARNLRYLRKMRSWSQQALADQLNIPRTTLAGYELQKSEPSLAMLQRIASTFGVSLDRLIADDLPSGADEIARSDSLRVLAISTDSTQKENIELVRSQAFAGYTQQFHAPEFISALPKISLPMLGDGTYRAFEITGDSMLPIEPGSVVICSYVERLGDIRDGRTYVLVLKEAGIVYKRLYTDGSETQLIAASDNSAYPPYSLNGSEIQEVWQYRAHVSFNDRADRQLPRDGGLQEIRAMLTHLLEERSSQR